MSKGKGTIHGDEVMRFLLCFVSIQWTLLDKTDIEKLDSSKYVISRYDKTLSLFTSYCCHPHSFQKLHFIINILDCI